MVEMETTLGKLEVFFSGATVFSAVLLLGYLVLGMSASTNAVLLGVGILLLALVVGIGSWYETRWLRLAAWPATLLLVGLGFVGVAIGPQIITVAGFALLSSTVMTLRDYRM